MTPFLSKRILNFEDIDKTFDNLEEIKHILREIAKLLEKKKYDNIFNNILYL